MITLLIVQDVAGNVGETEIAAAVTIGKFLVVDSQQIQNRRVNIVNMSGFFDGFEAELVSSAVNHPALDRAAGEPHREPEGIMIAALLSSAPAADFAHGSTSKLGATHHQRIL